MCIQAALPFTFDTARNEGATTFLKACWIPAKLEVAKQPGADSLPRLEKITKLDSSERCPEKGRTARALA